MVHHNSESSLVIEVKSKQHPLMDLKTSVLSKHNGTFSLERWCLEVSRNVVDFLDGSFQSEVIQVLELTEVAP